MSDEDEKAGSVALARPEEEALRLKTLAEQKYASSNLKSALKYAKRAHKLHPSLDGLPEMLTAFKILRTAAKPISESNSATQNSTPDYYKILQVEPFSHINTITKQYKKLALTLHPDKNPLLASEEAFKLVGEAARVLSDKIRRKEYDMRLRIAIQSKATEEVDLGAAETFWTACSTCRLLHQFERKYLGHRLMCPRCKKSFKAMEVEEDRNDGGNVGVAETNEAVGEGHTRVSARIRERVAKGGNIGIVEKCGLGVKRKITRVGEVLVRPAAEVARHMDGDHLLKDLMLNRVDKVEKSGERDGGGVEGFRLKKVGNLVNVDSNGDGGVVNEVRLKRVGGKVRDGVEEEMKRGRDEIVESGRAKRAKAREEETMTLSQMQMLAKKKKADEGKLTVKEKQVSAGKLKPKKKEGEKGKAGKLKPKKKEGEKGKEKDEEPEKEKSRGEEKEQEMDMEKEKEEDKEKEMVNLTEKRNRRRVSKDRNVEVVNITSKNPVNTEIESHGASKESNLEVIFVEKEKEKEEEEEKEMVNVPEKRNRRRVSKNWNVEVVKRTSKNPVHSEIESHGASKKSNLEVMLVEKENENENEKEKGKEMENTRETRQRCRVSKYANLEVMKRKTSESHVDSEYERLIATKRGNLEIMPVADSDFHDFDKDRRERSFKKGQVWAVYDDDDGMPRHYALIDKIVSVHPFVLTLSWLQFESSGDEELVTWQKTGFHVSCGRFKVSNKVSIKYLNLFSHVVDCERAAREVYRIYPKKGSVWALYNNNALDAEGRNQTVKENRFYDIVVTLSSYSDVHGLSIAHLEKVDGFRTVFKRREIGANAVILLGKNDVKLFSHQIPAKKLSGEEASGLPKDCWELDPASLTPQLLIGS